MNENPKIRRIGPIDVVLVLALAVSVVTFIPAMRASTPSIVVVRKDTEVLARYPVERDIIFTVEGKEGPLSIAIAQKGVSVIHATCKNQVCVKSGVVRQPFQQIICAPNHVVIEISSSPAADTIDAVLQ